ncbi:hypothetical protein HHL22_18030 [Hymenobacter sp. RP-2-7]|uniref:T9SS type A sorting domain-containing protein n=1 Tax=Hymenobacter polaris TaxID=2682546 RepID=A0A7Y0FNM2_9BACT|nr:hypothetical protein [Hymenobacter polaris]NML67107.1 hypothetical protein [Hymenobacter polaris]
MKQLFFLASVVLLAPASLLAQTKPKVAAKPPVKAAAAKATPAAAPAKATAAAPATAAVASAIDPAAAPVPIPLAPVTPPADPNALKIKTEVNPISHLLTVRCDAPGPTRIEINDKEGRPILTKNTLVGTTPVTLNVATLPAGPYVVRCTAGDKKGTRLVQIN